MDMICRKTMSRCQTPGMCSPHGGCPSKIPGLPDVKAGTPMPSVKPLKAEDSVADLIAKNRRLKSDLRESEDLVEHLQDKRKELKAKVEALRNLAIELRGAAKCYNLHHCKAEQHAISEPCKVLARIDAVMGK